MVEATSWDDLPGEAARVATLRSLDLLDSPAEEEFDALCALTAQLVGAPVAMLSLVDRDRQFFKAKVGLEVRETPREGAFCNYTIQGDAPMIVPDATRDPRFSNPHIAPNGKPWRFYAGVPIKVPDEDGDVARIGALCAVDTVAHDPLSVDQEAALRKLGQVAERLIAARTASRDAAQVIREGHELTLKLARQERTFRQAERLASIGSWRYELDTGAVEWSPEVYRLHGLEQGDKLGLASALDYYPPRSRATVSESLTRTIESGAPFDIETDFRTHQGIERRVRIMGELELDDQRPVAVIGTFQDVTEHRALEESLRRSANYDELTGLVNRASFNRTLEDEMARAAADSEPLALLLIDLDSFKAINDTHGHLAGDDVLRSVGQRLLRVQQGDGIAARLGGDEFALLVRDPARCAEIDTLVAALLADLKRPVWSSDGLIPTSSTIGVAALSLEMRSIRDFLKAADAALYAAKRAERGTAQHAPEPSRPPSRRAYRD